MKYKVHGLTGCRVCRSPDLYNFLKLDNMPFTDDFVKKEEIGSEFLYDINVFYCKSCNTVQTLHDVAVDKYYEDYQYSVGASTFALNFMNDIAEKLYNNYFGDEENIKVLEIGSGDGGQLVPFKELGCKVLGYEPSSFLIEVAAAKGISSIQGLFDENAVDSLPEEFKDVNIILLSYTFDHIPDPIGFLNAVKKILNKQNGILVIENHDLEKIFDRREYCLFEHEHSIYLTKATVISLAKRNDLDVIEFDVLPEENRRANSLIFVLTQKGSKFVSKAINEYPLQNYNSIGFYDEQSSAIYAGIKKFEKYIDDAVASGKTIAGYGAGGRGIMTLSALKNANKLQYIVDKKPKSNGVYAPKFHLPVYEIGQLIKQPVDEAIVFSFGYMKEIKEDLKSIGYKENQISSMLDILK